MKIAPFNDPTIWNFAIPFAAAALLVVMLVDTQLAFLTGIVTALFAGHDGPDRNANGDVCHDLLRSRRVRDRTLSRATIRHAGGILRGSWLMR